MPNSDPNDGFSLFCGAFIVLSSPSIGMKWLGEDHPTVIPYNSCPVYTYFFKEVAIDSRLSPAKVRWRQPAVSSELSLVTAS